MKNLQISNQFLIRLSKIKSWDSKAPVKSGFQIFEYQKVDELNLTEEGLLIQRLNDLLNFPLLKEEYQELIKNEGPSLVYLIRLLSFSPRGLSKEILINRGFPSEKIADWSLKGYIYQLESINSPQSHNGDPGQSDLFSNIEDPQGRNTICFSHIFSALMINEIQPLVIPVRRLAIPLSIILHQLTTPEIKNTINNLAGFLKKINKEEFSSRIINSKENLNHLIQSLSSVSKEGNILSHRISLSMILQEFFHLLEERDSQEQITSILSETDRFAFFSDSWQKENSFIHFRHPGNDTVSQDQLQELNCYPVELPTGILLYSAKLILGSELLSTETSFFETETSACSMRRSKIYRQMIQQLGLIQIYKPTLGDRYPQINYIPIEGKWQLDSHYFPWIFSFFQALNLIERSSLKWLLTKRATAINNYTEDFVIKQFFRYLMWHPGFPFLYMHHDLDNRKEEQIKTLLLLAFNLLNNHWIEIPPFEKKEKNNNENERISNWDQLVDSWTDNFKNVESVQKIIKSFLGFLFDQGWLLKVKFENREKFFIPNDFPVWNPFGDLPDPGNDKSSPKEKSEISFITDSDLKFDGESLSDIIFLSRWSELIHFGNFLLFRLSRESIETFLANGNQLSEIETFLNDRVSGEIGSGFQVIKENIREKSFPALFFPDNRVIYLKDLPECKDVFKQPGFQASLIKSFQDPIGNYILLIRGNHVSLVKEIFKENNISLSEVAESFDDRIRPLKFDQKDQLIYFDFFAQRLLHFFYKEGLGKFLFEKDIEDITIDGEELTQLRIRNLIGEAIRKGWKLEIQYFAKSSEYRGMFRIVRPMRLEKSALIAYCYLRNDERMFLLNRMGSISTIKK